MFLLVTGASGMGKTTARMMVQKKLGDEIECVELFTVVDIPAVPDVAWRQRSTETIVQRALKLQDEGKHLMLSGDPIAAGEVRAAPSADQLEGIAVLLLDASAEVQTERLKARGDDLTYMSHHIAFADWMREHVRNPQHMPEVIMNNGWDEMRWERWADWQAGDPRWTYDAIDTTTISREEVAAAVLAWVEGKIGKQE